MSRHVYVGIRDDVGIASSVRHFSKGTVARKSVADKGVPPAVNCKRLKTVPVTNRVLRWSTIADRRREVGFTRAPTTTVKESKMIRPHHLGCLALLTTIVFVSVSHV